MRLQSVKPAAFATGVVSAAAAPSLSCRTQHASPALHARDMRRDTPRAVRRTGCATGVSRQHKRICGTRGYAAQEDMRHKRICGTRGYAAQEDMRHKKICGTGGSCTGLGAGGRGGP